MGKPIWTPSAERVRDAALTDFIRRVEERWGVDLQDRRGLWEWTCAARERFWTSVWEFCGVLGSPGNTVLEHGDRMPGARFFPDGRLNFAENLLRDDHDAPAFAFQAEDRSHRHVSRDRVRAEAAGIAAALRAMGVGAGDRVGAFLPNVPEAVSALAGVASLGGVWSSCSPDFGVDGVVDRFGQIEPVVLFTADGYRYKGKEYDSLERAARIVERLPSVRQVIVVPYLSERPDLSAFADAVTLPDLLVDHRDAPPRYERLPFNHPLYVLYSSGTTGKPKCIVHGAGGTLLEHLCEHRLMCDIRPGDRMFYFTTLGWMMWNWLVTGLASGATLLLYDGNPAHPRMDVLWEYFAREKGTLFGTSAKYLDALRKAGVSPGARYDLSSLRTLTSTGSPLVAEGFDYVYEHVKADLCLSSISGGTDIVGCFVGGNPVGPVWRGEIQARGLGMDVDVFNERGESIRCRKGELVCKGPFPSMPLGFWDDPDDARYRAAYFERYPNVWHHGDFAEITEHDGVIIYGRSDATLNPGGVRIGTAEIYRQVELFDEVQESVVIGQDWQGDTRIVLFVKLRPGARLTDDLEARIRERIREACSPRHVPARILEVDSVPRTKSGKIVELAVRKVVHGEQVHNVEALANPDALEQYRNREELAR